MIKPTIPYNEDGRIKALQDLNILDTIEEEAYDQLTFIASQICDVPIALISLIDTNRQWFKSHYGLDARETDREIAFCAHAINNPKEILVVEDANKDERFYDNPLSTDTPNVIFYAGVPLLTDEGFCLGTLCVIDNKPRKLSDAQTNALKAIANQVLAQLDLRRKNLILTEKLKVVEQLNNDLDVFTYQLSHDIQTPMRGILSLVEFLKEDDIDDVSISLREKIDQIENRANYGLALVNSSINYIKNSRESFNISTFNLENTTKHIFNNSINTDNAKLELLNCNHIIITSKYAIQVALQNLITNSVKFSDKNTCVISISSEIKNGRVFIDYKDNGPGIDMQYAHKIFEIFETLNAKSENSIGIGLAMVKTILNRVSGNIKLIHSESGEGVHFNMDLPLNNK